MELKKDPATLALAAVCVGGLVFLVATAKITWTEMTAGVLLLGLPSIFGASKETKP